MNSLGKTLVLLVTVAALLATAIVTSLYVSLNRDWAAQSDAREKNQRKLEAELKAREKNQRELEAELKARDEKQRELEAELNAREKNQRKLEAELKAREKNQRELEAERQARKKPTRAGIAANGGDKDQRAPASGARGERKKPTRAGSAANGERKKPTRAGSGAKGAREKTTRAGSEIAILLKRQQSSLAERDGVGDYTVNVLYGTDRRLADIPAVKYGPEQGEVTYGACTVTIPKDHRLGALESPSIFRFEIAQNPEKHVVVRSVKLHPRDSFFGLLKLSLDLQDGAHQKRQLLVFLHGYNTSFEDAARRTAQLAYDLKYEGVPMFWSWPSQHNAFLYTHDVTNVRRTVPNLAQFLRDVAECSVRTPFTWSAQHGKPMSDGGSAPPHNRGASPGKCPRGCSRRSGYRRHDVHQGYRAENRRTEVQGDTLRLLARQSPTTLEGRERRREGWRFRSGHRRFPANRDH